MSVLSHKTALLIVLAMAPSSLADMGQADFVAYNAPGCDNNGYYQNLGVAQGYPDCSVLQDFDDPNYNKTANAGEIDIYWGIPDPDPGCNFFIREPHTTVDSPGCGTVVEFVSKSGCYHVPVTTPFELNWCCGTEDCNNVLSPSGKRSIDTIAAEEVVPDVVAVKTTNPFSPRLGKREDCQWIPNDQGTFTIDGEVQTVTAQLNCPPDAGPAGCSFAETFSVSSSVTNTFGVSETTTVKELFDIVEQSVSFNYEHADTEEHSVQLSYTMPVAAGRTGYLTWIPTLECDTGEFSGSECSGVQPLIEGNFCVPVLTNNDVNQPQGEYQVVNIN